MAGASVAPTDAVTTKAPKAVAAKKAPAGVAASKAPAPIRLVAPVTRAPAPVATKSPVAVVPAAKTDPNYGTCKEAKAHGAGPYFQGKDPEYDYYQDRDGDGIVCE